MLSYTEPSLVELLVLLSFLTLLQLGRQIASTLLGAGLLGECAIGIIFGSVAKIVPFAWEETFLVLGYLGLLVILLQGGLELRPRLFLPNLPLSVICAILGIGLPIGLTFALFAAPSCGFSQTSAFAAGAALSSTSLGTTFFVLDAVSTRQGLELASTKVGTILQGAALVDDVVALALLAVLDSLGEGGEAGGARLGWVIVRPLLASAAMAVVAPLVAAFVVGPAWRKWVEPRVERFRAGQQDLVLLSVGVLLLSAFLTISSHIHTTPLLGAFLTGASLSSLPSGTSSLNFLATFSRLVRPLQNFILAPLFFASIGYSIPFLDLWTGPIVWKGVVYGVLMALGKVLVGGVLLLVDLFSSGGEDPQLSAGSSVDLPTTSTQAELTSAHTESKLTPAPSARTLVDGGLERARESLVPAAFLGSALVARGEIGLLVLQATRSAPHPLLGEEAYLVAIWAVALCTIAGPVAVSALVTRRGKEIVAGRWGLVAGTA